MPRGTNLTLNMLGAREVPAGSTLAHEPQGQRIHETATVRLSQLTETAMTW